MDHSGDLVGGNLNLKTTDFWERHVEHRHTELVTKNQHATQPRNNPAFESQYQY